MFDVGHTVRNPYQIANSLRRLQDHMLALAPAILDHVHKRPAAAQVSHRAYHSVVSISTLLPPLRRAVSNFDQLPDAHSSKEFGLRATRSVILPLAPMAIALTRSEGASSWCATLQRRLHTLEGDIRRITNIWWRHRVELDNRNEASKKGLGYRSAIQNAWQPWLRLRASMENDVPLRYGVAYARSASLRNICSNILNTIQLTCFDDAEVEISDIMEAVVLGRVRWN
jgi:hypothetical protein